MENIIYDNQSECSDTDSLSDLDPQTIDLTNGDFSPINTKLFNIASYNINSITSGNKRDQIESLAHQLNLAAICLSETKLDDNVHESFFHIPGYNIELKHRTRRGGGVCIYIRDDIPFVRVNKLENKNLEHISVDITIRGKRSISMLSIDPQVVIPLTNLQLKRMRPSFKILKLPYQK